MKVLLVDVDADEARTLRAALADHEVLVGEGPLDTAFVERWGGAGIEALSVCVRNRVDAAVLKGLRSVRLIATRSTGFDHIDGADDVIVCNVPDYGVRTVAEFTFGLLLQLTRRLHAACLRGLAGDFAQDGLEGVDLSGRTLGVIGAGRIGQQVVRIARGFEMTVLATDPREDSEAAARLGYRYVPLDELLAQSDIVTLHAPLTEASRHVIDERALTRMRSGAYLVNTGRGGLVDTAALLRALGRGHLAGAALDVIEDEERLATFGADLMQRHPNLILTPHVAYNTREARGRILATTAASIRAFAAGAPVPSVL